MRVPICTECLRSFPPIPAKSCVVCGLPLEFAGVSESESLKCAACRANTYAFECARSYSIYKERTVKAILLLKFEQLDPLGKWFADRLAEIVRANEVLANCDVVVPVPLHRDRLKDRGYNQAELISKPLAKRLKLRHRSVLLVRKRPRPDKHILTLRERWDAVRGAFATSEGSQVDNLRVLLLDDVMTTGATLDACARVLRQAGAKSVSCLTVARAARNPLPVSGES